jgi:peptidyl-prolyl cis-trans isomerase C
MKLRYLTIAIGLTAALAGCDQLQNAGQSASTAPVAAVQDTSAVVATVNGTPITEAVLDLYEEQMKARRPGPPMDRQAILEEVINLELASQSGSKEGLNTDIHTQLQVDQQRRAVIATAAIQKYLDAHPITDEELQKLYDEQVPKGNEFKARHILVDDEEQAKKLIGELDKGADFSELAKTNSTGPSGKSGGELGWFSPKQMVAPFSEAVAKLEKGKYTKEPVKTQFGWHVIILDDVRESTPPSFEQVKPQLQAFVQKQRVQSYINGLRQGAQIDMKEQPPAASEPAGDAPAGAAGSGESTPE